jgi:hypothetical protein
MARLKIHIITGPVWLVGFDRVGIDHRWGDEGFRGGVDSTRDFPFKKQALYND